MTKKTTVRDYLILTAATVLLDVGIYFFKFPNSFSFGGISGISVILAKLTPITPSAANLILNMALLLVGFLFVGRRFAVKTVYVSILSSLLLYGMEFWFPLSAPLTNEPVIELIFAILLPAVASAVFFNLDASSGGTDIVAMILKKYTSIHIGLALLVVDSAIALSTFFIFDIKTGLCSVCGLLAKSLVIDNVIENINSCKYFNVICDSPKPICDFICNTLRRSATVVHAQGAYSQHDKYVIMTAMKRSQAVALRKFIKETEPSAFLLISNTSEIIGKGFRGFN